MNGRAAKLIRRVCSIKRLPYRPAKRNYSRSSRQQKACLLAEMRDFVEARK